MPTGEPTLDLQFSILVYPFYHELEGPGRALRLVAPGDQWRPWWARIPPERLDQALDDTAFFVPYVRELLFPETGLVQNADRGFQVQDTSWLASQSAAEIARIVPDGAVVRLTLCEASLTELKTPTLSLAIRNDAGEMMESYAEPFCVDWIDVAVFPQGVGFPMIKTRLACESFETSRLREFLRLIRLVYPPRLGWSLATWEFSGATGSFGLRSRDLIDYLLQDFSPSPPGGRLSITEYAVRCETDRSSPRYSSTRARQTYGSVFHVCSYARLRLHHEPPTPARAGSDGTRERPLDSPMGRALYELTTCTDLDSPDYVPHPQQVCTIFERGRIDLWWNWRGLALHDSTVVLGTLDGRIPERVLPHNLEWAYFPMYVLALYQKTRIGLMFGDLLRRDSDPARNAADTRRVWEEFLMFQNRYWYSEVTVRPLGTEIYRRFQAAAGALDLYKELADQVRELGEHYDRQFQGHVNRSLALLTWVLAPLSCLGSFFGTLLLEQKVSWGHFAVATILSYAALWLASGVVKSLASNRGRPKGG